MGTRTPKLKRRRTIHGKKGRDPSLEALDCIVVKTPLPKITSTDIPTVSPPPTQVKMEVPELASLSLKEEPCSTTTTLETPTTSVLKVADPVIPEDITMKTTPTPPPPTTLPKDIWFMISKQFPVSFSSPSRPDNIRALKQLRLTNREINEHVTPLLFEYLSFSRPVEATAASTLGISDSVDISPLVREVKLYSSAALPEMLTEKYIAGLRMYGETSEALDRRICTSAADMTVLQSIYSSQVQLEPAVESLLMSCTNLRSLNAHISYEHNLGLPRFHELVSIRFIQSVSLCLFNIGPHRLAISKRTIAGTANKEKKPPAAQEKRPAASTAARPPLKKKIKLADVAPEIPPPSFGGKVFDYETFEQGYDPMMSVDNPDNTLAFQDPTIKTKHRTLEALKAIHLDFIMSPEMEQNILLLIKDNRFIDKLDSLSLTYHSTPTNPTPNAHNASFWMLPLLNEITKTTKPSLRSFSLSCRYPPYSSSERMWYFTFPTFDFLQKLTKLHLENIVLEGVLPLSQLIDPHIKSTLTDVSFVGVMVEYFGRGSRAPLWEWVHVFGALARCSRIKYLKIDKVGYVSCKKGDGRVSLDDNEFVSGEDKMDIDDKEDEEMEEDEDVKMHSAMVEVLAKKSKSGKRKSSGPGLKVEGEPGFVKYHMA